MSQQNPSEQELDLSSRFSQELGINVQIFNDQGQWLCQALDANYTTGAGYTPGHAVHNFRGNNDLEA